MRLKLYPVAADVPQLDILGVEHLTETPTKLIYKMKHTHGGRLIEHATLDNGACGEWEIDGVRYNAWLFQAEHLPIIEF